MIHIYHIEGMTCGNCQSKVTEALQNIKGVDNVDVDFKTKQAEITMNSNIEHSTLQKTLPEKYTISKSVNPVNSGFEDLAEPSKIKQLKPLFLILFYIAVASILIHRSDWNARAIMTDFMGLFLIVFSFFKMLDLKGFASTFSMYDPLAIRLPFYSKIYPFIETGLGLMLLLRFEVNIALILTIIILGLTSIGVTKTLLSKRKIKCACLGTALNLPMTEATFIENALMIVMGVAMLILG